MPSPCLLYAKAQGMLDRIADSVKDAVMDWELPALSDDQEPSEDSAAELPPVAPAQLIQALQARVESTISSVAEAINANPTGRIGPESEDRVLGLIADLVEEALQVGLQLRITAVENLLPPSQMPEGQWARKFRFMLADEGRWPATEEVQSPTNRD
jgi:hypothetical protein